MRRPSPPPTASPPASPPASPRAPARLLPLLPLLLSLLAGCDAKLDTASIERDIQKRLHDEHALRVTAACPKERTRPRRGTDHFTCQVTLADDTTLEADVEVNADGEAHWRLSLNSRSYIEQTLAFAIATRRAAPDTPLTPIALSCPDAPKLDVGAPIQCEVTWPNGQRDRVSLDLLDGQDSPSWRAPASLRMYDAPAALTAHLLTLAQGSRPHLVSLDCDDVDTLLVGLPVPCDATYNDPQTPHQPLEATLQPDGAISFR